MRKFLLRALLLLAAPVVLYWTFALIAYRWLFPPATPLMLIRSFDAREYIAYQPVAITRLTNSLPRAVTAAEDSRFCLHHGIDLDAVEDALDDYRRRGRLRGASTISMQVARNIFLWPGGGAVRKAIEAPLALAIDALWPKRRIMELYLNIAEWGPGVFGAQAAARHHFGINASRLSALQAARLAAVLPSPRRWSPSNAGPYVKERGKVILRESARLPSQNTACFEQ